MLYIKNFTGTSFENLLDSCFNSKMDFPQTFFDKDCTNLQCFEKAHRSFSDILILCQTYFPETTEKNLANYLINKKIDNLFCFDINKLVFFKFIGREEGVFHELIGSDGWSLQKIKNLLK
jgi:hypothetical protein